MKNIKIDLNKLGFEVSNTKTTIESGIKNKQFKFDYKGCFNGLIRFDEYCESAFIELETKNAHETILYVPMKEVLKLISIRAYTGNVYDGEYVFNEKTGRIENI